MRILNEVLAEHAPQDDELKAAAQAFASPGGFGLGGGRSGKKSRFSGGAGGASDQGGAGGGGAGGWVHLSDVSLVIVFLSFWFFLFCFRFGWILGSLHFVVYKSRDAHSR